jgi:hypothetical protein
MQMGLDLIEEQNDAVGGSFFLKLGCLLVLLPRPNQQIRQSKDAAHASRRLRHRHRPIWHLQGGSVAHVIHTDSNRLTDLKPFRFVGRKRFQHFLQQGNTPVSLRVPRIDITDQAVTEIILSAPFALFEPVPNIVVRKVVSIRPARFRLVIVPIVARWIPDREAAVLVWASKTGS